MRALEVAVCWTHGFSSDLHYLPTQIWDPVDSLRSSPASLSEQLCNYHSLCLALSIIIFAFQVKKLPVIHKGFPHSSVGKESTCNAGECSQLGRSAGEGIGYGEDLGSIRKIPRRKESLLTPVFWPGELQGL